MRKPHVGGFVASILGLSVSAVSIDLISVHVNIRFVNESSPARFETSPPQSAGPTYTYVGSTVAAKPKKSRRQNVTDFGSSYYSQAAYNGTYTPDEKTRR